MSHSAAATRRSPQRISAKAERALSSAAGAATHVDGAELLLDMPDAQVGRILKSRILAFRQLLAQPLPAGGGGGKTYIVPLEPSQAVEPEQAAGDAGTTAPWAGQAQRYRRALVQQKALLSSAQMWQALSLTRQAVSAATRSGRLFTVDVDGESFYPAFFADGAIDRATLEKVSRQLDRLPGWAKWDFFTAPRGSLGGVSPLDALRTGRVDDVLRAAKAVAEEARR